MWKDCTQQKAQKDCENKDKRDCMWIANVIGSGILGLTQQTTGTSSAGTYQTNNFSVTGSVVATGDVALTGAATDSSSSSKIVTLKGGVCVPNYPPGLKFWTGEASGICSQANAQCEVTMETKGFSGGSASPTKNGECLDASWQTTNEKICESLGDCVGANVSIKTKEGVYKYLQSGSFGVSGTGLNLLLSPFIKAGNYISGLAIFNNESLNQGLVESMKK
jgi:hypothetical protein